uniref:ABC transporter domain-containing protein n=1 Tax=Panagrellus redivivus TaxID=6233 RepID=A0A7E4V7J5_PANRE
MFLYHRYIRISPMEKASEGRPKRFNRDYSFGWAYFRSISIIFKLIFSRWDLALLYAVTTICLVGLSEYITNHIGSITGDMYTALMNKDKSAFWKVMWRAAYMYLAKCGTLALITYASWLTYIEFRRNLVKALQKKYFTALTYYKINCIESEGIDNPDQRITQDVEKVCNDLAIQVLPYGACGPFVVAYYTYKTWSTAGAGGVGMTYVFFLIGVFVNFFLMKPIAKWTARVEKQEGNFRYKHISIRDNAESLALYRSEQFENTECNRLFNFLIKKQFGLTMWMLPVSFWQQYFDYFGGLMSYGIQYIPIIVLGTYDDKSGADLAGIISKNAFVYIYLINSLTRYTDLAINVGQLAGVMQRLSDFVIYANDSHKGYSTALARGECNETFDSEVSTETLPSAVIENKESGDDFYRFENVAYGLPNDKNRVLIRDLTLTIPRGARLLLTGPSGCGKSSFIRILSRIWNIQSGRATFGINLENVMPVPQRPYMPAGNLTLRQQFTFPRHFECTDQLSQSILDGIIKDLELESVVQQCNGLDSAVDFEWHERFTPGELQRISFGRVLLHRPTLALLDEATNSVTEQVEEKMYTLLQDVGISYVSVGHRMSLRKFHDTEVMFDGSGGFDIVGISDDGSSC